jgi:hypothetical protein
MSLESHGLEKGPRCRQQRDARTDSKVNILCVIGTTNALDCRKSHSYRESPDLHDEGMLMSRYTIRETNTLDQAGR